jgi:hypothetical protein
MNMLVRLKAKDLLFWRQGGVAYLLGLGLTICIYLFSNLRVAEC